MQITYYFSLIFAKQIINSIPEQFTHYAKQYYIHLKIKFDNTALAEDFFDDTHLLGVVAPIKDYYFVWQLNQLFNFNFVLNNSLEIQLSKRNRNYYFSVYEFTIPNTSLTHYLYTNQYDGEYLLPELKHLDFLWLVKGQSVSVPELHHIIEHIRKITSVQLVMELTNEKIKSKENLIL